MEAIQWGGRSANDPRFLSIVKDWIEEDGEVYALFWFHRAGGAKSDWLFDSFKHFTTVLTSVQGHCSVDVYRHPQFPVRGIVGDEFIRYALANIPDGQDWYLMAFEESKGQKTVIESWGDSSHQALLDELANHVGRYVVIGPDIYWPVPPNDYPGEWISGVLNEPSEGCCS